MIFNLVKREDGSFMPSYPSDHEKAKKLKVGNEYSFTHKKIRNVAFHRKYFAMIRMLFDSQEVFTDQTIFRKYMEMKAGYYTVTNTGVDDMILPKSIAFEKLSEDDFSELYGKVCQVAYEKFGMDNENIAEFLKDFF